MAAGHVPDARRRPVLAGRSARRHQGVHQEERRVHGEHRPDRGRQADARHRAGAGAADTLWRGDAELGADKSEKGGAFTRDHDAHARRPTGLTACASRSHAIYSDLDIWFRNNGLTVAERIAGRLVAEILPDRRGQGRHLSALRPDQRMGHRGGPGRARGGGRRGGDDRRPAPRSTASRASPTRTSSPAAKTRDDREETARIDEAARLIRAGELVAFPTETVYGLGADATNERAVASDLRGQGPAAVQSADQPCARRRRGAALRALERDGRQARRDASGPARSRSCCRAPRTRRSRC